MTTFEDSFRPSLAWLGDGGWAASWFAEADAGAFAGEVDVFAEAGAVTETELVFMLVGRAEKA